MFLRDGQYRFSIFSEVITLVWMATNIKENDEKYCNLTCLEYIDNFVIGCVYLVEIRMTK